MNQLAEQFRIDRFDFRLIAREGDVALFRKTKPEFRNESFEVVIVQHSKDHVGPRGNLISAGEVMPRNEQWGTHGWSYRDIDDAQRKFRQLVEQAEQTQAGFLPLAFTMNP